MQSRKTIVAGFLFHQPSGKVLLHLRSADAPTNPGTWAFFGGKSEPEDSGDPVTAWRREMREEIGVELDPTRVMAIHDEDRDDGHMWHSFFYEWPELDEHFVLTEGDAYAWFTLDEALSLPNLIGYAQDYLPLFRKRQRPRDHE